MSKGDLKLKDIGQYYGTLQYHTVLGVNVTDGIKYIIQNGYSWLVTDAIVICKTKLKKYSFISIKLKIKENVAKVVYSDGNNVIYAQDYKLTDAQIELNLYYTDNVLMLSQEY